MKHRRWKRWHPRHWRRKRRPKYQSAWQPSGVERLDTKIEQTRLELASASHDQQAKLLEKLLVLQTPRAALAQAQMDAHPRGYHSRDKRLFELIDFNDTFVDCVLAQPQTRLAGFVDRMKLAMTRFCHAEHTPMFTDLQFDAIVRGLSREIAVFLGAKSQGFDVTMTSRTEDAFGIDMIITDPSSKRFINIDIKTPSAFRYRLEDLEQEGRITGEQLYEADQTDFITVENRHDRDRIPVAIVCVRPERLGDVIDFRFQDEAALGSLVRTVIAKDGLTVVQ